MNCPNCQSLIPDDAQECGYCGVKFKHEHLPFSEQAFDQQVELPLDYDTTIPIDPYTKKPKMLVFNMIFAVMLLVSGWSSFNIPSLFIEINEAIERGAAFAILKAMFNILTLAWSAFSIAVGVMLIMRKRLGYKCAIPIIWFNIGISVLLVAFSILITIIGVASFGEYAIIGVIIGIAMLVFFVPMGAFYIYSLKYYKKHEYYFTE